MFKRIRKTNYKFYDHEKNRGKSQRVERESGNRELNNG